MRIISLARYAVPVRLILNFCAWSAVSTDVLFFAKDTERKTIKDPADRFHNVKPS